MATAVDESRVQYRPFFNDESAVPGKSYTYRVEALNESGSSDWSNVGAREGECTDASR